MFFSAIGRSFYEQILPDESVDFAFSCTALHWLEQAPCYGANYGYQGPEGEDEQDAKIWKARAEEVKANDNILFMI